MSTSRGRPPRWAREGGSSGSKIAHCASVISAGYGLRGCRSGHLAVHSLARGNAATIPHHSSFANICFRIASKRLSGNSGRQFQSVCRHASVMEGRPAMSREFAPHQMDVAQVEHRRTRLGFPFIVFAMAPRATMPGVGTLHHPTFLYGREAFGPFWPRLHLNVPRRAMFAHPCEQRMIVILVVGKDRFKTGKIVWLDQPEQVW